ncbi:amino acid/amide ABC transporter membrane protein 2, HAAT family (TC 3.A.1.4.-), partial [Modestobacter sp. DSM 44400]|uniref:branched-chain amino acid ABC transporter permease n=1 Tax=Modestobacter sp. DSM 44400 TaxID=1550230 RepID=UPI0008964001
MTSILAAVRGRASAPRPRLLTALEVGVFVVLVVMPLFLGQFTVSFATRVLLLVMLALSFELAWGYGGIFSFGQAVFFGWGAYVAGLLSVHKDLTSIFIVIPAATLTGLVLAAAMGAFLFLGRRRVSLIYVSLATLAVSYAAERLAAAWTAIGAANGIPSIPVLTAGESRLLPGRTFYYLIFAIALVVYLLFRYIVRSQFGLVLVAGRTDLQRVTYLGYNTAVAQLVVFTLAGAVAGMAGGFYAFHEGFVSPSLVGVVLSTQAVLYVLFGGVGTLIGPVIGTVAIEGAGLNLAQAFPDYWPIILGLLLLGGIMFLPNGIIGLLVSERARVVRFGRGAGDKKPAEVQPRLSRVSWKLRWRSPA